MKRFKAIFLVLSIFALVGCQNAPAEPTKAPETPSESLPADETPAEESDFLIKEEIQPEPILGEDALVYEKLTFAPSVKTGDDSIIGKEQLIEFSNGLRGNFMIKGLETLEFQLGGLGYGVESHLEANASWFSLGVIDLGEEGFFLIQDAGHEGIPTYYHYMNGALIELKPAFESVLGDFFVTDSQFPPFSLELSESYIRFTEENYCCDTLYDSSVESRKDFREVFIMERTTPIIVENTQIPRFE